MPAMAKLRARWGDRYKAEASLARPTARRGPGATEQPIFERIVALRRQRFTGQHVAHEVGVLPATVSRVLARASLSRLTDLERPSRWYATNASSRAK